MLGLQIEDKELHDLCLLEIQELLMANDRSLQEFVCLPQLDPSHSSFFQNSFIMDELNYNKDEMVKEHTSLLKCLTAEQLNVYENIISSVVSEKGGFFLSIWLWWNRKNFHLENIICCN